MVNRDPLERVDDRLRDRSQPWVHPSADSFLAGRTLPWWLAGVSMYATSIDSSDLVADSGGTYTLGSSYFVTNRVGVVGGWMLVEFRGVLVG